MSDENNPSTLKDDELEAPQSESPANDSCVENDEEKELTFAQALKKGFKETVDTFKAFIHAPREIKGINLINIFEGMAYFGVLTLITLFLTKNVMLDDVSASWVVSGFLMLITLSQLFLGGLTDKVGPKKMLGVSIVVLLISRFALAFSEMTFGPMGTGLWSPFFFVIVGALLIAGLAYGVFNPAVYSLTRMYSDKKTSAVSYAMLYAGMNLGAFIIGLILPHIRRVAGDNLATLDITNFNDIKQAVDLALAGASIHPVDGFIGTRGLMPGTNGYSGALIFITGIMLIVLLLYVAFIARSKNKPLNNSKDEEAAKDSDTAHLSLWERIKRHPLADGKFDFFIFILIPVQTIFAYQNILIPVYLERCFRSFPAISENYETFSNINPLIVFLFAPVIAALTAKQGVYKMMIIGTAVMALPTFLLAIDTTPEIFFTFVIIGAIGESMWQPRFLQHVTEIAPKDRVGAYVGIANLPWFMTKFIVGLYVGFFMREFIPEPEKLAPGVTQDPQTMWLIFAIIACISPVALFAARKWMNPKKVETA